MESMIFRATCCLMLATYALSAAANDFSITPNAVGLDITKFRWSVSIDGAAATDNPQLTVLTGQTYTFSVSTSISHPFWIDNSTGLGGSVGSDPYPFGGGTNLSDNGVTGNEVVTFTVPIDAPDTLYYACGNHLAMIGEITVVHDLVFRNSFD